MTVSNIERDAILNAIKRCDTGKQLLSVVDTLAVSSYGKQAPVVSYQSTDTPIGEEVYGG